MGGDLVRGVGHVHHLGGRGAVLAAELAVAQPEVQRRAHHHDQVRLPEGHRPRAGDQQVVPGRQDASRLAVRDHGQRQLLGRRPGGGLRRAEPHVGAEHQHRAAGAGQQAGDHVHVGGVGGGRRRRHGAGWPGVGRLAEQGLQREVEENRSPVRGGGDAERLVDRGAHLVGPVLGPGALGDRGEQQRVVDLLQAARAPAVIRRPAAQHDHRGPVEVRRGDRADAVRHPRAGGEDRQAGAAGEPRRRLGREHRGLLVPDVDQAHRRVGLDRPVVEGEHMPAGEGEHRGHVVPAGGGHRPRAAVTRRLPAAVPRGLRRARPAGILVPLGHARDVTSAASPARPPALRAAIPAATPGQRGLSLDGAQGEAADEAAEEDVVEQGHRDRDDDRRRHERLPVEHVAADEDGRHPHAHRHAR